jgi:hypothetical protein
MTGAEAMARAETCDRLISHVTDANNRVLLKQMKELWLNLANVAQASGGSVEQEFDRLVELQNLLTQRVEARSTESAR